MTARSPTEQAACAQRDRDCCLDSEQHGPPMIADEQGHAQFQAGKIASRGGEQITQLRPMTRGDRPREMLEHMVEAEKQAIADCTRRLRQADAYGEIGLNASLENQLADDTRHREELECVLAGWRRATGASRCLNDHLMTSATNANRRQRKMPSTNSVVAVFETHDLAEAAVRELQKDGFDMKTLSLVGKDYHTEEHVVGYYTTGDRMMYWGGLGAFWGGFWGLLFGSAFFWVPGVGPLLAAGPLVMWIVAALEEAAVVGGLSALGAGLYSMGIPENSALRYETEVKNDKLLLVAHGTAEDVERANALLHQTKASSTTVHAESGVVAV